MKQWRKMRQKRLWSILLAIVLVLGMLPLSFDRSMRVYALETPSGPTSGDIGDGNEIHWELTEDAPENWDLVNKGTPYKLTISGSGALPDYRTDTVVPWNSYAPFITTLSIGEGITAIGNYAFDGFASLPSVVIPDSVVSIGRFAFGENSLLADVTFGAGLRSVDYMAFYKNISLTDIQLNEGFETLGSSVFYGCSRLQNVTLPDSLKTMSGGVLQGTRIEEITIPKGVTSIGTGVFRDCRYLYRIQVAEGNSCFQMIDGVLYQMKDGKPYAALALEFQYSDVNLIIPEGTEIIAAEAFYGHSELKTAIMPATVREIGMEAFSYTGITEITIPDLVEKLDQNAFGNTWYLKSVTIGKGLKDIFQTAFWNTSSLTSITVSEENPYLDAVDNVLYSKDHTVLYLYAQGKPKPVYHALNGLQTIGEGAIRGASNLEELYLPETVASITLENNSKLKSIYFCGNAPSLSYPYITGSSSSLIIYKSPESTGWDAAAWNNYTRADWNRENDIELEGSFGDVTWLYEGDIGRVTFKGIGSVPDFSEANPAPWSSYLGDIQTIEVKEGVTGIGANAFAGAVKLLRVETGGGMEVIGETAFAECPMLLFVDIAAIKRIGKEAFRGDAVMESALDLRAAEEIGEGAFYGCESLVSVTLGEKLSSFEKDIFSGCTKLAGIILPESVTAVGEGAFRDCAALRTVNIPASVNVIAAGAFSGCTALCMVYFYGGLPQTWAEDSFSGCTPELKLCYRKGTAEWEEAREDWNGISLRGLDRFYTEQRDHYSFGSDADVFGYADGYRIPRQRFVDVLDSIVKGSYYYALNYRWIGSCFGMTGSSLEFYENPEMKAEYFGDAENLYAVSRPGSGLTKRIEAFQVSQCAKVVSDSIRDHMGQYRKLIQRVEEFERSGGLSVDAEASPVVMEIYGLFGSHAVVPVSVKQEADVAYTMKIYDPDYPSELQTLKILKDYSGISYGWYFDASYVDYTTLADVMKGVTLYGGEEDTSFCLSVNQKDVNISNAAGISLDKMEGAYEQRLVSGGKEDVFGGIRSFVLPEDTYKISGGSTEGEDEAETGEGIRFFFAGQDVFAEIASTDSAATLTISRETDGDAGVSMNLKSQEEGQMAVVTLVNSVGMEHELEIVGTDMTISVSDNSFTVEPGEGGSVSIDGELAEVQDGKAGSAFAGQTGAFFKIKELESEVACDEENRLSGTVRADLAVNCASDTDATVRVVYRDAAGKQAAVYMENQTFHPGVKDGFEISFERIATNFTEREGEVSLTCRLEIETADGKVSSAEINSLKVALTKKPEDTITIKSLESEVSCDMENRLKGTVHAAVDADCSTEKNVTVRAAYLDETGKQIAVYTENQTLRPGTDQALDFAFEQLAADFTETEGEVTLTCRFEIETADGKISHAEKNGLKVKLTKKAEDTITINSLESEVSCDGENRLKGTVHAAVDADSSSEKPVTVRVIYLDETGKQTAVYTENKILQPGKNQALDVTFEQLAADFTETEGEVTLTCRLEIEAADGKIICSEEKGLKVTLTKKTEDTIIIKDLETEVSCDKENRLKGTVHAVVDTDCEAEKNVIVRVIYLDKNGKRTAVYTENRTFNQGKDQTLDLIFEQLAAGFAEAEGEITLTCRLEIETADGKVSHAEKNGLKVTLTKKDSDENPGGTTGGDTGKNPGGTSSGNKQDNTTVKAERIKVSASLTKVAAGKKTELKVSISPKNATNKKVKYTVSDPNYATVKNGIVTVKKAGAGKTVTITATAEDGSGAKGTVKIRIMKHAVKRIQIKNAKKYLKVNKTMKLKAVVNTTGKKANKKLKWISSNNKYAVVDKNGKVTAKKGGKGKKVIITAVSTDGTNRRAKVKIKIK